MYKNMKKIMVAIIFWGIPCLIGVEGVCIFLGVLSEVDKLDNPIGGAIAYLFMAALSGSLVYLYWKKYMHIGFCTKVSDLLEKDDDGYVPIEELAPALNMDQPKFLKNLNKGLRKGYIINVNYSAAERAILCSDRYLAPKPVHHGKPEDKPFVGVHCEGCGASLKIRVKTRGYCPFCGREIIQE